MEHRQHDDRDNRTRQPAGGSADHCVGPDRDGGWPSDKKIEALRQQFAEERNPARRRQLASDIQVEVYADVIYIPGGEVMTTSAIVEPAPPRCTTWRDAIRTG